MRLKRIGFMICSCDMVARYAMGAVKRAKALRTSYRDALLPRNRESMSDGWDSMAAENETVSYIGAS